VDWNACNGDTAAAAAAITAIVRPRLSVVQRAGKFQLNTVVQSVQTTDMH